MKLKLSQSDLKKIDGINAEISELTKEITELAKRTRNAVEPEKSQIQRSIDELLEQIDQKQIELQMFGINAEEENLENAKAIYGALERVKNEWLNKNPSAAYIISDGEFIHIEDFSTARHDQNVQVRRYEPNKFAEYLANELKIPQWQLPVARIKQLYNECNRTFDLMRYSITEHKWTKQKTYLPIQHMEQYFINNFNITQHDLDAVGAAGEPYHSIFDVLMYSLSGGKQENLEHIQRWMVHKVKNYRKAVTTPELVLVGHVGGNGKGILQGIMRLMFPATLSGKANGKTLTGNFNAIMIGKLIVFFDDQNTKEIPLEVVKQLAGSDTMIYEPKGKDQYEGEKTHSSAWFSNKLPFTLTPAGQEGGVDRRFSIMRTNITFLESIILHYSTAEHKLTMDEAKEIAEALVATVLLNRIEIARWFKYLESLYPDIDQYYVLKPLHGEDYRYFLDQQQDAHEVIFRDLIAPIINAGGCVPLFAVRELLRYMDQREYAPKAIGSRMRELAEQNKVEMNTTRVHITIAPSKLVNSTKQCTVFKPKSNKNWISKHFDWNLISNRPYGPPTIGETLINEDNVVFGSTVITDDYDSDE